MNLRSNWKQRVQQLKLDAVTIYLAARDPRVPWYARVLALGVAGYLFSPIDLIPDWIPVFGYLDDMLIVPLGILLVIRITPQPIIDDCRERAAILLSEKIPHNRVAAICVITFWLSSGALCAAWVLHYHFHQ